MTATAPSFNIPARRGFDDSEYAARCRRLQHMMGEKAIDLLLFTTAAELAYCCGFATPFWRSPTRPWFMLLPAGGKPVAVIPTIGSALMRDCYVEEVRCWPSPHPHDDGISVLAQAMLDLGGGERFNLGMMRGRQSLLRMPPADFDALRARLPLLQLHDISREVQQLRMIKSAAEIDKIATACRQLGSVFEHWQDWLHSGMPLRDICRQFKIHCLHAGADDAAYLAAGLGRGGYSDVISPPDDRVLSSGDLLMLDSGCTYDQYYCDFDRNIACQHADDDTHRCYETLWHATRAGIAAAVAGARCRQVFAAMRTLLAEAGYAGDSPAADVGRYGHGLGLELTETPSITAWDDTVLAPGMVLAIEPSALLGDGRLMVHEENIVIGDDGKAHLLTKRAPPQLPLLAR